MAASSPSVLPETAGGVIGKYTLICELGGRSPTTFAAYTSALRELVIVERIARARLSAKEIETFTRAARRMALIRNPHFSRVREVFVTSQLVAIASDFVEGETLEELTAPIGGKKRLELAVRLAVLVDLLAGLDALHTAPELENGTPAKSIVHGEVTPANVLVGLDGTARIIRPHRMPRPDRTDAEKLRERVKATLGYVAPETLVGDGLDLRADLYAVGVMLWEAISGERLFAQSTPEAALTLQLAGDLPRAKLPDDGAWAEPLVNIAARALQVSPERRFSTAKDFADAIRRAVQPKLAPTLQVAAAVSARAGERIEARRLRLKPPQTVTSAKTSAPRPARPQEQAEEIDWQDVVEAKAPARSMPPPIPSRKPSRGPSKAPSGAPPRVGVPSIVQAPLPTIIALKALLVPVAAPPLAFDAPATEVAEAPDTTPDLAPTTTEATQRTRLRPPRTWRVGIVAGLVALCVMILVVAAIRAAFAPKDAAPLAKKSDPVEPIVRGAPPPSPIAAPSVVLPAEPASSPREVTPPVPRIAAPKTTPKPRPKSNYEPQSI